MIYGLSSLGTVMFIGHFAFDMFSFAFSRSTCSYPASGSRLSRSHLAVSNPLRNRKDVDRSRITSSESHKVYKLPYSHSLILGTLIACAVGLGLAYFTSPLAGLVFIAASASHWLLDATVHQKDLPVLGFGLDRKFGFGLWNRPKTAFIFEYLFYAVLTALTFPSKLMPLLVIGAIFHLINANSFLGLTKTKPFHDHRI